MTQPHRKPAWDLAAYASIRRWRDASLRPLSRWVAGRGVHPTAISLAGVALAASLCWLLPRFPLAGLAAFLAALGCDALDGAVARQRGVADRWGKLVDHACDAATFLLVLLAVAICGHGSGALCAVAALLAVPLLLLGVGRRRRREATDSALSGGFFAHAFKTPIYAAVALHAAGGLDLVEPALRLANLLALASLAFLLAAAVATPRRARALERASRKR